MSRVILGSVIVSLVFVASTWAGRAAARAASAQPDRISCEITSRCPFFNNQGTYSNGKFVFCGC